MTYFAVESKGKKLFLKTSYDDYLNTVEAYDEIADEWSYMPSMIESVYSHSLNAIKNKLFAIKSGKKIRIGRF